jgi:metal-sulfur cluster biosynthetic enzyme
MGGVDERGSAIPGIDDVDIELVWEPPWSPQMMSPAAKEYFGIADDDGR